MAHGHAHGVLQMHGSLTWAVIISITPWQVRGIAIRREAEIFGSGGAYIGQKLSSRLGVPFLDREIIKEVARRLNLAEAELADREERLSSFWQNFANMVVLTDPAASLQQYIPSDRDMFEL